MSQTDKVCAADVRRWVAAVETPAPPRRYRSEWKTWSIANDVARANLRSWGLGDDGQPLPVKVTS